MSMKIRVYIGLMVILLMIVGAVLVDVVTAQDTPIETRLRVCDGRTVTPMPKPTWTPDPITAAVDHPVAACRIGTYGHFYACITHTTLWECAQFGIVNGDARIWGSLCPRCLDDCDSCAGIAFLPLVMKTR